jgi:hypothetical protein
VCIVTLLSAGIIAALFVIDRIVIPKLEDELFIGSYAWKKDSYILGMMTNARTSPLTDLTIFRSDGIRVTEKKTKLKRIIVVGDSFVSGFALANINDVWWRALQRELASRGYNDVEIVGLYGNAYGNTAGELQQAERWAAKYNPDAIIWSWQLSDAEERGDNNRLIVPRLSSRKESGFVKVLKRTLRSIFPSIGETLCRIDDNWYADRNRNNPTVGYPIQECELKVFEGENLQKFQTTLRRLKGFTDKLKVPNFFVTMPSLHSIEAGGLTGVEPEDLFNKIEEYHRIRYGLLFPLLKKNSIQYYDLLDPYLKAIRTDPQFQVKNAAILLSATPTDSHPGSFTTHLYAREVADILEKKYPATLGSKTSVQTPSLKINDWVPYLLKVTKHNSSYIFTYPQDKECLLFMPLRKPHVQINFEMPVPVKKIRLTGPYLRKAQIWLTAVDPKDGYDRHLLHNLGEKKGFDNKWTLPDEPWTNHVNTCKITAEIKKGADSRLQLSF